MAHKTENGHRLLRSDIIIKDPKSFDDSDIESVTTFVIRFGSVPFSNELDKTINLINNVESRMEKNGILIIISSMQNLASLYPSLDHSFHYQTLIGLRSMNIVAIDGTLPNESFGALILTKYSSSLKHVVTRIGYEYCRFCDRTTKDYGGKKHTYHEFGTMISDVWTDIKGDLNGSIDDILVRFQDLFGLHEGEKLLFIDTKFNDKIICPQKPLTYHEEENNSIEIDILVNGDCLDELKKIPSNSIDFAFADPPYNLSKKYSTYADSLEIQKYFEWCDDWIDELFRIIKPGRTVAILNIPIWAIRHFNHMIQKMTFQNWIVWDALSYPVRKIMPAHYGILCFSKGEPRDLPLTKFKQTGGLASERIKYFKIDKQLDDGLCIRESCVIRRAKTQENFNKRLTDLWTDIHRLKHNSRRVDHPCQLPPELMYRLICTFTYPGEVVIDCFNGAGTTTLTAEQMGRRYIGIELSEYYHNIALSRHHELREAVDPFRKENRILSAKNSPVERLKKMKYEVSKKELQLEIKRISLEIGHIPTKEEVSQFGRYPIDYYERYFSSWGEVCAAARTTGMTEYRKDGKKSQRTISDY